MIAAKDFKPSVTGRSDFFSWQMYRWLKKHPYYTTIWAGTWNHVSGIGGESVLYIGGERDENGYISARWLRNLCLSGENLQAWAYGPCHDTANWKDISDWFWSQYRAIGVCAIHGDYAHKWVYYGEFLRECQYCKTREAAKTVMAPSIVWAAAEIGKAMHHRSSESD